MIDLPVHVTVGAGIQLSGRQSQFGVAGGNFSGLVIVAGVAGIYLVHTSMAGLAGHLTLASVIDRESMLAQGGWLPGVGSMAIFTAGAKETGMDDGFLVAIHTFCGCAAIHVILMAVGAVDGGVFTGEGKDRLVGEPFQSVYAVVTGHTVRPILGQVLLHEGLVVVRVATDADRSGGLAGVAGMARGAVHGLAGVIHRM